MENLEHYQKKISESLEDISRLTYNAELYGAQQGRVALEQRTFATGGSGVKDVAGKNLSKYSKAYAKRREKAGLQIANKDLIFSSDTSVIKDNITVGTSEGKPAYGFLNEESATIAGYQEKRENTKIFVLNPSERESAIAKMKEYLLNESRKIVQKWRE